MPLAVRDMLIENGIAEENISELTSLMLEILPERLADHALDVQQNGFLLPGAIEALRAVDEHPGLYPTVVTGNLRGSALLKLSLFLLDRFLDTEVGGYSSDDSHRPNLVGLAQYRANSKYGLTFTHANTVIIGDSLEDVRTGREGGASVVGVASGRATQEELRDAGADVVLEDLLNANLLLEAIDSLAPRQAQ